MDDKTLIKIGKTIKILRVTSEETQEELAKAVNISKYTVFLIEAGATNFTIHSLSSILNHYKYHMVDFWKKVYDIVE